jgi:5-methyltetrahydropteroyltriglutamate--homocysteine methyltransferase
MDASCDPKVEDMGQRPDDLVDLYIHSLNDAIAAASVHMRRGNFKGHYLGSGGCESVAERFSSHTNADHFLLEYERPAASALG